MKAFAYFSTFFLFSIWMFATHLFAQVGKVGIGTTSPTAGLEILTDGSALNALRVSSSQSYNSSPDAGIGFRIKYNTAGAYTSGAVISGVKENGTDGDQSGSLRFLTSITNGTIAEKMRITSGGDIGVGTISPGSGSGAKFEVVQGTTGRAVARFVGPSSKTSTTQEYPFYITTSEDWNSMPFGLEFGLKGNSTSSSRISYIQSMTVNTSNDGILVLNPNGGNVGIGTTTPSQKLEVSNNIILGTSVFGQTSSPTFLETGNNHSDGASNNKLKIYLYNNGPEKYGFSVGPTSDVQYHSNKYHDFYIANSLKVRINDVGNVTASGFTSTSDARLKNVLQSWENDDQIDFVQFRWKNGSDIKDHFGYLAQDVQRVLPDAVHTDNEGMMSVNYDEVHSFKIFNLEQKAIQQSQRINELESSLEELKKLIKKKRVRK